MARSPIDSYREAAELRSALRRFMRRSEEIARRHGLTPNQYLLLVLIKGTPDGSERSTVTDLVERLALSQSTVTELVQRAERAGLLQREQADHDARVAHLRLTDLGEQRLGAAFTELGPERRVLRELIGS
jgi:DNA-binding MarR family transcriptional regulator